MASEKKHFAVTGMGCAACASRIETTLNKQAGVIRGIVNFAAQTADVEFDPAVVDTLALKASIQSIGYDLVPEEPGTTVAEDLQKKN